jgi:HK97 family phage major capsid protein
MNKQQQRAAKIARQQQLVNAAKAANRSLTTEEQSEFDTLQREIDTLTAEIAAEEAQQQRQATGTNPEGTPAPEGTPTDAQRAVEAERTRITDITAMCRDFGVDPADYISNGTTVDQVRAAILEQLRTNRAPLSTSVQAPEKTNSAETPPTLSCFGAPAWRWRTPPPAHVSCRA